MKSHSPQYRPDIDGLRAVAVLGVLAYHFDLGCLPGGFVGVDVFFVISGFLITSILHREMVDRSFSFGSFYERRVRRLFPALFFMMAVVLGGALWLFFPSDLVSVSRSTSATLLFVSSIFYSRNYGYFNPESGLNPLLHTWSLAVEEQFYFVFPIFLLAVMRFVPRQVKVLLWTRLRGTRRGDLDADRRPDRRVCTRGGDSALDSWCGGRSARPGRCAACDGRGTCGVCCAVRWSHRFAQD